jgi:hypothetical protein
MSRLSTNEPHEELLEIADRLEKLSQAATVPEIKDALERVEDGARTIGKAWSGSCLGYHARIYYRNLEPPPPGAHFSPEWGMEDSWPINATTGEWIEYDPDAIKTTIFRSAGNQNLEPARDLAATAERSFRDDKPDILSIFITWLQEREDAFIASLKEQAEQTTVPSRADILNTFLPAGQSMTRDTLALTQGRQVPPILLSWPKLSALGGYPLPAVV